MRECEKCHISVATNRKTCPLCGNILVGKSEQGKAIYPPFASAEKQRNIALRILLFLAISSMLISIFVNLLTNPKDRWSVYVVISVIYSWILLRSTIMSKKNIAGRLLIQMIAVSLLCIGIEKQSHSSGWALDYVVPFLCIVTILAILIIIFSKQMFYSDYLLYLLLAIIISFVPMILYLFKQINILWPSIAAASVAIMAALGMILFADRATKDELKKRFHL